MPMPLPDDSANVRDRLAAKMADELMTPELFKALLELAVLVGITLGVTKVELVEMAGLLHEITATTLEAEGPAEQ